MKWIVAIIFCLPICFGQSLYQKQLFPNGKNIAGNGPEYYVACGRRAMVASEGEIVSQIGAEILKKGGNAIDAAIAVSFAISVYRPQSTGIGGGGFMIVYLKQKKEFVIIDMRERAPLKATRNMYLDENGQVVPERSRIGALAVATPGLVAGLYEAHRKFGSGKLTWKELVMPSVLLARNGFKVYPHMAHTIEWIKKKGVLDKYAETKKLLTDEKGNPLKLGDVYRNANLAKTLEIIAEKGRDGFYRGEVARQLISSIQREGGIMTQADLDQYQVKYRQAIRGQYRGYEIVSMPPPSSGGTHIVQILNILENFDLGVMGFERSKTIHLKAEAMRRAYADRSRFLGDPDFFKVPVKGLLSKDYADELCDDISLRKASKTSEVQPGNPEKYQKTSTTHFSIIDKNGNAVSSTQTINYYYGSIMVAGNTGIFLNNEMDDFAAAPKKANLFGLIGDEANSVAPGKRPLSSMSPTIVLKNDKVFLILGSPGGSRIITSVLNVIINVIDHKMNLRDAVFAPRIHHQWHPDILNLDKNGFSQKIKVKLQDMGHTIRESSYGIGNVSAIMVNDQTGEITGVTDPRREGRPAGY